MRIGFDATVLSGDTRYTGTGRYAEGLLRALQAASRDQHEIVAVIDEGAGAPFPSDDALTWLEVPRVPLSRLSSLATHLLRVPRLISRARVDVYHVPLVHTRPSLPPVPSGLACPLVVTIHDVIPLTHYASSDSPLPRRMRWFYSWNLRRALRANRLITVSEFSKREIVRETGAAAHCIDVIPNGVSLPVPADREITLHRYGLAPPFVLYVGSMEPRKNLQRLIEAFRIAVDRGFALRLALVVDARSGHADALHAQLASSRVEDRVTVLTGVPGADLSALYAAAAVFAFPTLAEGFGLPPVEAMLAGTPVLASRLGALPEVLGDAPRYVDALDPASIAEGLMELAADEDLRLRSVEAGRRVAAPYTWDAAAAATMDVYRRVLHADGSGVPR